MTVDGIASPQRPRSRPDMIAITSSCDVNDKGNRRAKVMLGLSDGFHCGAMQPVGGFAMQLPLYGQSLFRQRARARVAPLAGQWTGNWVSACRRGMPMMQVKSQCPGRCASDGWSLLRFTMFLEGSP